jgi:CheY-like chemotaxis protein
MPEMDGVEATERIRSLGGDKPYYKNLPIVALTANAVSGMREMFLQSGFDDFLAKPIDTVKLDTILEKWIPQEKRTPPGTDSAIVKNKTAKANKPPPAAIEIEGLDTKKGIRQSGGTVEYYYATLATFHMDGLERQKEIRKCLDAGNWSLYTTYVHALKGASANIGAYKLSEAAYALESAGQRGDLTFIKSNTDHFLAMLERLLSGIDDALSSCGVNGDNANSFEAEQFKVELVKLRSALENMDIGVINRTADRLLASARTNNIRTAVRNISKHILLFEYEEAAELIESLLLENQ